MIIPDYIFLFRKLKSVCDQNGLFYFRLYSEYLYFIHKQNKTHLDFHTKAEKAFQIVNQCFQTRTHRSCVYDHKVNSEVMPVSLTKHYIFCRQTALGQHCGVVRYTFQHWFNIVSKLFPRDIWYFTQMEVDMRLYALNIKKGILMLKRGYFSFAKGFLIVHAFI